MTSDNNTTLTQNDVELAEQEAPGPVELSASQMAHDLNNFLCGMRMIIKGLRQSVPLGSDVEQGMDVLDESALRAAELCERLQAVLKGELPNEAGEEKLEAVNLSSMVDKMKGMLTAMVDGRGVLDTDLADNLPPIIADATQLQQVVLDLFTNASQALGSDGGSVTIRTGTPGESITHDKQATVENDGQEGLSRLPPSEDGFVLLEVADTGCGIDKKKLKRIFEPSFTTKKDGHGLGLASVLRVVRGHGGAVTVDSHAGQGTRVRCIFPRATPKQVEQVEPPARGGERVKNETSGLVTVLLVEDNEAVQLGTRLGLESSAEGDFKVLAAGTGREATQLLREQQGEISVVLLDLNLPDCDGLQLFYQLRELAPELPVIVVSGDSEQPLEEKFTDQKPDGLMIKPYDPEELIERINAVVQR